MIKKETIMVDGDRVVLDPANLRFNETTLTEYIKVEGGWYDSFGAYLAKAERDLQIKQAEYDNLFNLKFFLAKEEKGGSDKLAEAKACIDPEVKAANLEVIEAKHIVARIKNHLRAWDKNHDNAQSLGHQLRREMSMLNSDIRIADSNGYRHDSDSIYSKFDQVDDIVKPLED